MTNELNEINETSVVENGFMKAIRIIVSILLCVEAVALFIFSSLMFFIAPLMGGLSMAAGAGGASEDQIKTGWLMILAVMVGPFIWTAFVGLASLNLFFRKSRIQAIIYSGLAIVGHVGWQLAAKIEFNVISILILLIPVAGLVVAVQMKGGKVSGSKFQVPGSPT